MLAKRTTGKDPVLYIRLHPELMAALQEEAEERHETMAMIVREILWGWKGKDKRGKR